MSFPTHRPRRLRRSELLRGMVRETRVATSGLIYPMFVCPGVNVRNEVSSMPGVAQQSVDKFLEECREAAGNSSDYFIWIAVEERCGGVGSVGGGWSGAARD